MGVYPGLKPPMISGIDLVGTIESTTSNAFKVMKFYPTFNSFQKIIYFW